MEPLQSQIAQSLKVIREKTDAVPEIGIILGTGLGKLADRIEKTCEINYENIPHFPLSTVENHAGKLIFGKLAGRRIVAMQGRFHYYEGYSLQEVTYPVRVLKALGIHTLFISNACGGISAGFDPGEIMVINDHINLLGQTPLIGRNDDRLGPRYPDMFS